MNVRVYSGDEEPIVSMAEGDIAIWFKTPNDAYITEASGDWKPWKSGTSIQQSLEAE